MDSEQAAQRDAALLAAGKRRDLRVPRRQAQRVGRDFERALERVRVARREDRLEALLLGRELVEIGAFLGIGRIDRFELGLRLEDLADAFLDAPGARSFPDRAAVPAAESRS